MENNMSNIALYAFEKFSNNILRAAYCHTGNMAEAEDITQDVFLKLHSQPIAFNDDEHIKAWLLRVTINKCINYHNSVRVKGRTSFDEIGEENLSCSFTENDKNLLYSVMSLPEKYSSVIFLYYYEGYTIREIAELLGKNVNTVNSLLQRARKKMKIKLEEEEQI